MAVQRHASRAVGDALFGELRTELADLRPGADAGALARGLVRRDCRHELVALLDGGRRAAFYDPLARRLYRLPFDERGVADPAADDDPQSVPDPAAWVADRAERLDWVHRRHRHARDPPGRPQAKR